MLVIRPGQPCSARGLTLLEVLVTITILALLLAIALPSMQDMLTRNRLKSAAQAIAEDLQWTRSEAIKRNRTLRLSLDLEHWCYGVQTWDHPCDCRLPPETASGCPLKRVSGEDFPGIRLDATFKATRFEPRRATADNGSLTLTASQGMALRVVLSRLGRVRLCAPAKDVPGYEPCDG